MSDRLREARRWVDASKKAMAPATTRGFRDREAVMRARFDQLDAVVTAVDHLVAHLEAVSGQRSAVSDEESS